MIRYRCRKCSQKIRCREQFAGKVARCPTCSHAERVPLVSTRQEAAVPPGKADEQDRPDDERESLFDVPLRPTPPVPPPDEEEERDSLLEGPKTAPPSGGRLVRYRCPRCNLRLRAPAAAAGRRARCPKCQKSAVVPGSPSTVPALSSPPLVPPSSAPFAPPGYEVQEQLGKGTFGVVYKARQVDLDRVVALKVMKPDLDPGLLPRFRAEAQAVARMQHPNIVQIFEVDEYQGRFFCALEYVDGGSLQEMLKGRPLPPRQAAEMAEELARAMHYAHQKGVVHRDLKPANILISRKRDEQDEGDSDTPTAATLKITDFGLAKRLDDDASQTMAGALIGTPSYMAPEQAECREVGPVADVWALGTILYEMLTGKPPFVGNGIHETLNQVRYEEPVPPRQRQRRVPRDLETICLKCLEKTEERRYESALDLADDLNRFLTGDPIAARPVGRVERAARLCRRNPVVTALSAAAVSFLLIGFVVSTLLYFQTAGERRVAVEAKSKAEAETARANEERNKAKRFAEEAEAQRKRADDQRKETQQQAERAKQASKMLTGMFEAADPLGLNGVTFGIYHKAGQKLTASDLLERAVKLARDDKELDPVVRAIVYHDVGNVYRSLGLHDKAEKLLSEALDIRQKNDAPPDDVADSLHSLAWLLHQRGDYLRAKDGYKASLEKRAEAAQPSEAARLNTKLNLCWLCVEMEEPQEGLGYCQEVLQGRERHFGESHRETAVARISLAGVYLKLGRPADAFHPMRRAIEDLEKLGIDKNVTNAITQLQGAVIQEQLNPNPERTLRELRGSLDLMKRALSGDHGYVMLPLIQLAEMEEKYGLFVHAFGHYEEAFQIGRDAVGLTHPQMLLVAERLAALHRRFGQAGKATELLRELLTEIRKRYGNDHVCVGDALMAEARHEGESGKLVAAQQSYEQAEKAYANSKRLPRRRAICLNEMGVNLFSQGKYQASEAKHREALKVERGPHVEVIAVTGNLLFALSAQGKYDEEFASLLADMHKRILELPANQQPGFRLSWTVLSGRLLCARGDHRKAAAALDGLPSIARAAYEHEEMARAYVKCVEALGRDASVEAVERGRLKERYAESAVARLRLWWRANANARLRWADAEWTPLREEPAFQTLQKEAAGVTPKK